jgi:hypothetical protein
LDIIENEGDEFSCGAEKCKKAQRAADLGKRECREMLERQTGGFGGARVGWAMRKGMRAYPFRVISR